MCKVKLVIGFIGITSLIAVLVTSSLCSAPAILVASGCLLSAACLTYAMCLD